VIQISAAGGTLGRTDDNSIRRSFQDVAVKRSVEGGNVVVQSWYHIITNIVILIHEAFFNVFYLLSIAGVQQIGLARMVRDVLMNKVR